MCYFAPFSYKNLFPCFHYFHSRSTPLSLAVLVCSNRSSYFLFWHSLQHFQLATKFVKAQFVGCGSRVLAGLPPWHLEDSARAPGHLPVVSLHTGSFHSSWLPNSTKVELVVGTSVERGTFVLVPCTAQKSKLAQIFFLNIRLTYMLSAEKHRTCQKMGQKPTKTVFLF